MTKESNRPVINNFSDFESATESNKKNCHQFSFKNPPDTYHSLKFNTIEEVDQESEDHEINTKLNIKKNLKTVKEKSNIFQRLYDDARRKRNTKSKKNSFFNYSKDFLKRKLKSEKFKMKSETKKSKKKP